MMVTKPFDFVLHSAKNRQRKKLSRMTKCLLNNRGNLCNCWQQFVCQPLFQVSPRIVKGIASGYRSVCILKVLNLLTGLSFDQPLQSVSKCQLAFAV